MLSVLHDITSSQIMPGRVKVRILAGRNLPVMDRANETTDAYVEVKLASTIHKTDVCRRTLSPQWNSEWFKFEVDDSDLQDEPLQIRLMDHDTYSANDAIGKVYIDLNPLLLPSISQDSFLMRDHVGLSSGGLKMAGWIPVYDTMHGIRGEVNIIVKVDLFSDFNKYRTSSCGVQFFSTPGIPHGFKIQAICGFVEELVVNDDPEYQWIDKIRTPRSSNETQYPFLTMTHFPPEFIRHLGGIVCARSIKLLDRIHNPEEPETRDSWWTELRMEIRSHAKALGCNGVLGYEETTCIYDDICIVSAMGTAAVLNHTSEEIQDYLTSRGFHGIKGKPTVSLSHQKSKPSLNAISSHLNGDHKDLETDSDEDGGQSNLDLTAGNKDVCILEADDNDTEDISLLKDAKRPPGIDLANTDDIPGLPEACSQKTPESVQLFTQVVRSRISPSFQTKHLSESLDYMTKALSFKFRKSLPCRLTRLHYLIDLPEQDEIQICLMGVGILPRSPKFIPVNRRCSGGLSRHGSDKFGSDDVDRSLQNIDQVSLVESDDLSKQFLDPVCMENCKGPNSVFCQTLEKHGIDITLQSHVPGAKISQYLGYLNFFFIRESTSIRESGGLPMFLQSFISEVMAILRAHVAALGGNAMVSYFMSECVLEHNSNKNQGSPGSIQCCAFTTIEPPHVLAAFTVGRMAVAGSSALGLGMLCYYGLGLASKEGAIDRAYAWPHYVRERIKSTYLYFGGGLVFTAVAAAGVLRSPALIRMMSQNSLLAVMGTLAALIGSGMLVRSIPYNGKDLLLKHLAWAVHCGIMGAVIAPLCLLGGAIVVRAAWYTAGVIGGLSAVAACAPSDQFLNMGGPLAIALAVVFAASLGSIFLPPTTLIGSGLYSLSIYGGLILFSGFLLYDTQRIIRNAEAIPYNHTYDPVNASISIYLDTMNIFIRIVSLLAGGGGRRK
ncbi:unnamed protein product [Darwinula stevensoni]|uniref:C2 domain-containing protein n=1 Tax=Darwinula stevensoni TaxID=69355 RepID=A0A7R8X3I8_9CRUS|nr:unnamed protein product [Darwinula stevensoni]CAG0885037.1 unnamed protein product [Darwinula stevensoni]